MKQPLHFFKLAPGRLEAGLRWRSLADGQSLIRSVITLVFALVLVWASYPACAQAASWYPVAEASQGQQRQFVDVDSIEPTGRGRVRAGSYYIDSRGGQPQRTDYLTEYDCDRRRFRDVEFSGPVGSSGWMPVDPDPLNSATLEYVCAIARGE